MSNSGPDAKNGVDEPNYLLFNYLQWAYDVKDGDLVNVQPLRGLHACDVARNRTVSMPTYFEGSAAGFQEVVDRGGRVMLNLGQIVNGDLAQLLPRKQTSKDAGQGVNPEIYDLSRVCVNSFSLSFPENTCPMGVAIRSNVIPKSLLESQQQQVDEMAENMGIASEKIKANVHIPSHSKRDTRPIPILKEVVNEIHGLEVTRTFGGITAQHFWRGLIMLEPAQCVKFGLRRPPKEHDAQEPPPAEPGKPRMEKAHNTWIIVPDGHVLTHIAYHPPSYLKEGGYAIYQLELPNRQKIPFFLMDWWTVDKIAKSTVDRVLCRLDHRNLLEIDVELLPITGDSWLNTCKPGEHYVIGRVSFEVTVTYTLFPKNSRQNGNLVAALSPGFPRLSFQMRALLDGGNSSYGMPKTAREKQREQEMQQKSKGKKKPAKQRKENDDDGESKGMDVE